MPNMNRWIWRHGGQAARQALRDQLDPRSEYWRQRAREAAQEFIARRGAEAYDKWCDTLPDTALPSWRDLNDRIRAELSKPVVGDAPSSYSKHIPDPEICQNSRGRNE